MSLARSVVFGRSVAASIVLAVFFFQAEDGIRDLTVTGVQTCALPILATIAGVADAVDDVADDRAGILAARIIAGDDHAIGQPRGHTAHFRPLAAITVAAAAEHAYELAGTHDGRTQRGQHLIQRVRRVGVVDDDQRRGFAAKALHAS